MIWGVEQRKSQKKKRNIDGPSPEKISKAILQEKKSQKAFQRKKLEKLPHGKKIIFDFSAPRSLMVDPLPQLLYVQKEVIKCKTLSQLSFFFLPVVVHIKELSSTL